MNITKTVRTTALTPVRIWTPWGWMEAPQVRPPAVKNQHSQDAVLWIKHGLTQRRRAKL